MRCVNCAGSGGYDNETERSHQDKAQDRLCTAKKRISQRTYAGEIQIAKKWERKNRIVPFNMITIERKKYGRDYPDWVKKCPLCSIEDLDAVITIESDNLNYTSFAIGKNCRKELIERLQKFEEL